MRTIAGALMCAIVVVVTGPLARAEALAPAKPEEVGLSSERLARIAEGLQPGKITKAGCPARLPLIARKGKLVYTSAFGFRDPGSDAPMPTDAIFRIYSMTKPIVSVAAMMLVEEGSSSSADPVSKFLPEFASAGQCAAGPTPTARYATARAGRAADHGAGSAAPHRRPRLRRAHGNRAGEGRLRQGRAVQAGRRLRRARHDAGRGGRSGSPRRRCVHQPGTAWEYSLAVDVLGRVVETVSGKRLGDLPAASACSQPLGMVDTGFFGAAEKLGAPRRAACRTTRSPATPIRLIDVSKVPANDSGGAGGVSTALDYLRFAQMLLNGGAARRHRGSRAAPPSALMTSDHLGTQHQGGDRRRASCCWARRATPSGSASRYAREPASPACRARPGEFIWAGYARHLFWVDPEGTARRRLHGAAARARAGPTTEGDQAAGRAGDRRLRERGAASGGMCSLCGNMGIGRDWADEGSATAWHADAAAAIPARRSPTRCCRRLAFSCASGAAAT